MDTFWQAILSYPVALFSILLITSLGYWLISTMLGVADFDVDVDLEADGAIGGEGFAELDGSVGDVDGGSVAGLLSFIGIGVAPLSIVFSVFALTGWFISLMIVSIFESVNVGIATVILVGSAVVGLVVAGRAARLLRPLFTATKANQHRELVGRICTVRTGRVDSQFGQAEVDGPGHVDHVIQVRCPEDNTFQAGDKALVVDVEDGIFTISADRDVAQTLG